MLQAGRRPSTPCGSSGWSRHLIAEELGDLSRAGPAPSARSRSAGSADSNASAAPVNGCAKLEARGVQELASQPVAVRRAVLAVAARPGARSPAKCDADLVGSPGLQAHAQQRVLGQRLARARSGCGPRAGRRCRSTSACADAAVAAERRVDRAAARRRHAPRPAPGTRARSAAPRAPPSGARCASSLLATTSSPEVSRSRRWTIPGRHASPPAAPHAASASTACRCGARPAGMDDDARPACRRPSSSSSLLDDRVPRASAPRSGDATSTRARRPILSPPRSRSLLRPARRRA